MAFEEVTQKLQYKKMALWEKGDTLIGKFIKLKDAGEYKGQTQWQAVLEITEDTGFIDYKDVAVTVGSKFGMALSTAIRDYFTAEEVGNLFKIVYEGKVANKAGDNNYHTFKILMDNSGNTAEGSEVEADASVDSDLDGI